MLPIKVISRRSTPVNCSFKDFLQISASKMANCISIYNSMGRSEIWDKFHEL